MDACMFYGKRKRGKPDLAMAKERMTSVSM
jgi:hypothetical protein